MSLVFFVSELPLGGLDLFPFNFKIEFLYHMTELLAFLDLPIVLIFLILLKAAKLGEMISEPIFAFYTMIFGTIMWFWIGILLHTIMTRQNERKLSLNLAFFSIKKVGNLQKS